jgi:glycosyltransferase involved in cell wall biosynthesis
MKHKKQKICFVATVDFTVSTFLIGHMRELSKFYEITVITRSNNLNFLFEQGIKARVIALNISRKINIFMDIFCLLKLILIFSKNRFACVHSITPKAGLLSMLAAKLTRIPLRIHTFTGQVWALNSGIKRLILRLLDKLIGLLSTYNFIDSASQKDFLIKEGVLSNEKALVFGNGSVSGVDLAKFKANNQLGKRVKKELKIPQDAFIFIYLGRLVKDKGVLDLARAFSKIESPNAYLIFVGPDEGLLDGVIKEICHCKLLNIRLIGFTKAPYQYLSASNVLCLPSYREGFGNVIIEAAAMGIPSIASDIYGVRDAIDNNITGLLHKPGIVSDIKEKMNRMLNSKDLVILLGRNAKKRASDKYDSIVISCYWVNFYKAHCHV